MDLTQLIGSLGFPIVMCILMFYKMEKQDEQHRAEMAKIVESLNNNTIAISQLTSKLDSYLGK